MLPLGGLKSAQAKNVWAGAHGVNTGARLTLTTHLLTKQEDYAWARPALVAMKQRQMQLNAGAVSRRGGNAPGLARDYSIKALRQQERAWVEQAETAYARFVAAWQERPQTKRKTVTKTGTKRLMR